MTLGARLLRWYRTNGRTLPWRNTTNPYRILVSEIMLQQTQVHRVIEYYHRWLTQFRDWKTLAAASNATVIKAWAGLGYNRRALMLRDIARQVVDQGVPQSENAWKQLKGIGPYTAAALSAFAQHKRTLPVDTNIRRVLARLLLGIPYPELSIDDSLRERIDDIMPKRGKYWDVPQAIFDLATMICTKQPDCANCPMKSVCPLADQFLSGSITAPKRTIKKANERIHRNKRSPDRIYRGRILGLVREHTGISTKKIGTHIDKTFDPIADTDWVNAMIERLIKDQMITKRRGRLYLVD